MNLTYQQSTNMKNIFILFVCFISISLIKVEHKKERMHRVDVLKFYIVDFSGTLFIPKTLQVNPQEVADKFIDIEVNNIKYKYTTCLSGFCLNGKSKEIPVSIGYFIKTSFPIKLFFSREVK